MKLGACALLVLTLTGCGIIKKQGDATSAKSASISGGAQAAAVFANGLHRIVLQNCGPCHGSSQAPRFALADAPGAQQALIGMSLVDLQNHSASRIVQKIQGGHQGFPQSLGTELQQAIQAWALALQADADAGGTPPPAPPKLEATFRSISQLILEPKCVSCHGPVNAEDGIRYDTHALTLRSVNLANPTRSTFYRSVNSGEMPENAPRLSAEEISTILTWIQAGAPNN